MKLSIGINLSSLPSQLDSHWVGINSPYYECCGMPQWELGDFSRVALKAKKITLSCSLMIKMEWPLFWPEDSDKKLAAHTMELFEYVIFLAQQKDLVPRLSPLPKGVILLLACYAQPQNQGGKVADLLQLIPNPPPTPHPPQEMDIFEKKHSPHPTY
jgi:hypothetical protein